MSGENAMQTLNRRQPKYHPVGDPEGSIYWSKRDLDNIIDEYGAVFARFQEAGWDAYVIIVEFNKLRGTEERRVMDMARAVAKLYGVIAKRMVGAKWPKRDAAGYFPVGVFFPHLPPSCRGEQTTTFKHGSRVNELHMRGVVIANRWKRLPAFLDEHIAENSQLYATGKIRNIRVERLGSDESPSDAVEYVLDGLRDRIFIPDNIMILDLGCSSLRPSAWPELDSCSGYDGAAVFQL
jgi:hypothetical protein